MDWSKKIENFLPRNLVQENIPSYTVIKEKFAPERMLEASRFEISNLVEKEMQRSPEDVKRFNDRVEKAISERIDAILKQEKDKGYSQGLEEGRKSAYEEEKKRLEQTRQNLECAYENMMKARESLAEFYEKSLTDMAFKVAEIVLRSQIQERPELVSNTISDILHKISKSDDVTIRLSQQEVGSVQQIKELITKVKREGHIVFEVDEELPSGDCVVASSNGEIGALIDHELNKLKGSIMKNIEQKYKLNQEQGTEE